MTIALVQAVARLEDTPVRESHAAAGPAGGAAPRASGLGAPFPG
jgi:hypothetical protein